MPTRNLLAPPPDRFGVEGDVNNFFMATFASLGLSAEILRALEPLGFETPTPIQEKTIPQILGSRQDVLAFAQTGTGKTAAFSLPIVHQVNPTHNEIQALVLCPTRELALQITKDIESYTTELPKINACAVYGGESMYHQLRRLSKGPQIVVGTPGRINDMVKRRKLDLSRIQWLVLDEADEMLNMGFKEELDSILATTPVSKQTLLFSATMPREVDRIASQYMREPVEIKTAQRNLGATNVDHIYYMVHARDKYPALRRVADANPDVYGIVFCETKRETGEVASKLGRDGYSAEAIHGDVSQHDREAAMQRFRNRQTRLLVATDVAARGIDVKDLTHVINYTLPKATESYIHRSGRTGRGGKSGTSIAIINTREQGKIRAIERSMSKQFTAGVLPTGEEICKAQLFSLIAKIKDVKVNEKQIAPYMEAINAVFADLDRDELIKHLVSMEFNHFLNHYSNAPDLTVLKGGRGGDRYDRGGRGDRPAARQFDGALTSLTLPIGRKHGTNVKSILSLVNSQRELRGTHIGNISLGTDSTTVELDASRAVAAKKVLEHVDLEAFVRRGPQQRSYGGRSGGYDRRGGRGGDRKGGGYKKRSNRY